MLLSIWFLCLVAFSSALPFISNSNFDVRRGEPFTLRWTNGQGKVTISLGTGAVTKIVLIETIATVDGASSYTWTPDLDLELIDYVFALKDDDETNYSPVWSLKDGDSDSARSSTLFSSSAPAEETTAPPPPTTEPLESSSAPFTSSDPPTSSAKTTRTSTSSTWTTSSTTSSGGQEQSGDSKQDSSPSSGGLSTGAKIGIGVGCGFGLLLLLGLGFLIFRMGKRAGRAGHTDPPRDDGSSTGHGKPELSAEADVAKMELGTDPKPTPELVGGSTTPVKFHEMDAVRVHEMDAENGPFELGDPKKKDPDSQT